MALQVTDDSCCYWGNVWNAGLGTVVGALL